VINSDRVALLEEEVLLVRHSGEIPEVALHAGLHYLCEDAEGPRLNLSPEEIKILQGAALTRYREIILRDLDTANRDRSLFRGIRRANHNWYRFVRFSATIGCPHEAFRRTAAEALLCYLHLELDEVGSGKRSPSINCSAEALLTFAIALGIDPASLPDNWTCLCEKGAGPTDDRS
jgi:hypothetical protein